MNLTNNNSFKQDVYISSSYDLISEHEWIWLIHQRKC